ncbi:hypothetical protein [Emticicia fontis]
MKKDKLLESFADFKLEKSFEKKIVGGLVGTTSTGECTTVTRTSVPSPDHYDDCDVDEEKPVG